MKDRCLRTAHPHYRDYGGRGVRICDAWLNDFDAFLRDMGPRPSSQHSLDRKDNNGDYGPDNCRWATKKEQGRNRRGIKLTELDVRFIRHWAARGYGKTAIGKAFNIKVGRVWDILYGKEWA